MGLEFNLTVLPWILAAMMKFIFSGSRSTLFYVEKYGGPLYNFCHLRDLNLDLDAPVGIVRRLGSLSFEKLGPPFHIQLLNEIFELLVGANVLDLQGRSETTLDKSNNQPTFLLSLLDIRRNLSTTISMGHIQG